MKFYIFLNREFTFFNFFDFRLQIFFIVIFLFGFEQNLNAQCTDCGNATCNIAPITDQLSVWYNTDGFAPDLGCTPTEVRSVSDGGTVTFCATYTTPAVLEEDFISFLGSIPNSNAGCDATNIGNWTITNSCGAITPSVHMTQEPNLPNFVQRPIWPVVPNTTYELCYDVTVSGTCSQVSNPCIAPHWVPVICELEVGTADFDCSDNDGNYDVTFQFSGGGQGAGTYTLTTNIGTIIGDDPNLVATGQIILENIPDGSGYSFTIEGDGVVSGCDFSIANAGYTCAACPKISSATVEQDDCEGNTATLRATVDSGTEGVDYYIVWYANGNPINQSGSSSVGLDGIYGTADDPTTALTYVHTLSFDGAVGACSFEEQVFTAQLYCIATETIDQGDINNQTTGGTIATNYVFGTETCVTLDLSTLPVGALAPYFEYQYRVTSGPPFGLSWICEAVMNVKTPAFTEGPFCHPYWATNGSFGGCPPFNPSVNNVTCSGSARGEGTLLVPDSPNPQSEDLGGINSTTPANGLWQLCVYDTYDDQMGGVEGVVNYAYLNIAYFLPPGLDINTPEGSIVDAVNISFPNPLPTAPVTTATHPSGAGNVTGLRICNAPELGIDFTLPNFTDCAPEITLNCGDALLRYSADGGATYYLTDVPRNYVNGQQIFYKVSSVHCPDACGTTGSYTLNNCAEIDAVNDNENYVFGVPLNVDILTNDFINKTQVDTAGIQVGVPNNGTASLNQDGTVNYIPDGGFQGIDTFQYIVCDTTPFPYTLCDSALVIINVPDDPCDPVDIAVINSTGGSISGNSVSLSAAAPAAGFSGTWTITAGMTGSESFSNANSENTVASGLAPNGDYTFRWTVTCDTDAGVSTFAEVGFCISPSIGRLMRKRGM